MSLIVHQLHLTSVRELDHAPDGYVELSTAGVVKPHMFTLHVSWVRKKSELKHAFWKQTQHLENSHY